MSYNDNNGYNNYDPNNYGQYNNPYGQYNGQNNAQYDPYNQSNAQYTQYNQYNNQYSMQYGNQYSTNTGNGYGVSAPVQADEISAQKYNLIIGGVLLYGFLVNVFMIQFCFDAIFDLMIGNPILFYILYFAMAIIGVVMVNKSQNPVVSFAGYNLIVIPIGMVIAVTVNAYIMTGYETVIVSAFAITAVVTLVMMFLASVFPNFFLSLGRTLGITLLVTVVIELITFFIGMELGIIDYVVVLLFCGYIGFDWAKANAIPKTVDNAVDSAAELYVDIANLFLRLMRILARSQNN
ncbi:MAG: Bax inhibitor-1 family protein [Eubacteriales bacterium]|nr:Bax inhibitor-1 family protein [Lachnospiraceae bacterium]MDO5126906.1 Bax inhibitor-1 family protein [Eubacteriales bacterium]